VSICRDCGAEIEYEDMTGWVDVETDGTYDICPSAMSANHHPEA
jgi:hypothetical protein